MVMGHTRTHMQALCRTRCAVCECWEINEGRGFIRDSRNTLLTVYFPDVFWLCDHPEDISGHSDILKAFHISICMLHAQNELGLLPEQLNM